MKIYKDLYAFAASAGAFEGYVYLREKVNPDYLPLWVDNLVKPIPNASSSGYHRDSGPL